MPCLALQVWIADNVACTDLMSWFNDRPTCSRVPGNSCDPSRSECDSVRCLAGAFKNCFKRVYGFKGPMQPGGELCHLIPHMKVAKPASGQGTHGVSRLL